MTHIKQINEEEQLRTEARPQYLNSAKTEATDEEDILTEPKPNSIIQKSHSMNTKKKLNPKKKFF